MLYSLSHYLKPTQHMLRPLHNASLSDISTPLNISDISAPTQPNNAIIGICMLKSPRFQINRLRTTPIKQQINDRPSLLFSTLTPKPAPERAAFQQNTRRTTQTKPDKPIAAPHKTTPKHNAAPLTIKTRLEPQSVKQKAPPHHTQPPLSGKKNKRFQTLSTAFSNSFVQTYNISVKQGKNDSIFV